MYLDIPNNIDSCKVGIRFQNLIYDFEFVEFCSNLFYPFTDFEIKNNFADEVDNFEQFFTRCSNSSLSFADSYNSNNTDEANFEEEYMDILR